MAALIRHHQTWLSVDDDEGAFHRLTDEEARVDGNIIVSLTRWLKERDELMDHPGQVAVVVQSHEEVAALAADFARFAFIALEFSQFSDGRSFSQARQLREQLGYRGELRAVGQVLRDQLFFMRRCGFDAFDLAEGEDIESALAAFSDYSVSYQPSGDGRGPAWRSRR